MGKSIDKDSWVFVVIQNPGVDEKLVGIHDKEKDIDFIPAFMKKEEAAEYFMNLPREAGKKYEVQAIIFEELSADAAKNGFMIFLLDKEGRTQEKIEPKSFHIKK